MNKVYCPWCGDEMKLEEVIEGSNRWTYFCMMCATISPVEIGKEAAYKAATARSLQKPLTLEEACESEEPCVYIEYLGREIEAGIVYKQGTLNDVVLIIKRVEFYREDYKSPEDYGKIVRCWAKNPTDEERKAAKWEE